MTGSKKTENIFECSKCGICCEHINLIAELAEYDVGNGVCKYLTKEKLCAIYEHRPDICSVEKMYEKYYCDKISWEKYYRLNIEGCRRLKESR